MRDVDRFLVFAEVVESGSFSRAAERLGLAKSSVSKKVSSLERQLGVRLIQRSTRRLRVTEEGKTLYRRCVRVKEELSFAEEEVSQLRESPSGTVRLSAPPMIANTRLTSQIPRFLDHYPNLRVELHLTEENSDLIGGGFDLALRIGELADSSLVAVRLCTINAVICASTDYLSTRPLPEHPRDLERENFYLWRPPGRPDFTELRFNKGARSYRATINNRFSSTSAMAVKQAVISHAGFTVLPDFCIQEDVDSGKLATVLEDYQIHQFPLSLIYPQREQVTAKVRALSDFIKTLFSDETKAG